MMRYQLTVFAGLIFLLAACSDKSKSGDSPTTLSTSEFQVQADTATVLTTDEGIQLNIPPQALSASTKITLSTLTSDLPQSALAGVGLQPDGLEFAAPVELTIPLNSSLPAGQNLQLVSATTNGPFAYTGSPFVVNKDGKSATGKISGFSKKVVFKECHAGVRDFLFHTWAEQQDKSFDEIRTHWSKKTGISMDHICANEFDTKPLNALLKENFEECGNFQPGVPLTEAEILRFENMVDKNRQVVLLMGQNVNRLAGTYNHSAVLTKKDGKYVIQNQLFITDPNTRALMSEKGLSSSFDMDFASIDSPKGLRDLRNGEVIYNVVKGKPHPFRATTPRAWPYVVFMCEKPNMKNACLNFTADLMSKKVLQLAYIGKVTGVVNTTPFAEREAHIGLTKDSKGLSVTIGTGIMRQPGQFHVMLNNALFADQFVSGETFKNGPPLKSINGDGPRSSALLCPTKNSDIKIKNKADGYFKITPSTDCTVLEVEYMLSAREGDVSCTNTGKFKAILQH